MSKYSNEEIIRMLQSSVREEEDAALVFLHRQLYPMTKQFVLNHGGAKEDAEDVLQEAMIAFFKMARMRKLPEQLKVEAYVFTICKNKWYRKAKANSRLDTSTLSYASGIDIPDEDVRIKATIEDEKEYFLNILQHRLGAVCYKVLVYFYYENRKMKEIAQLLSYSNEQVAKNKKSQCMSKLKDLVREEPSLAKAFKV